jgi:hypothetical protein
LDLVKGYASTICGDDCDRNLRQEFASQIGNLLFGIARPASNLNCSMIRACGYGFLALVTARLPLVERLVSSVREPALGYWLAWFVREPAVERRFPKSCSAEGQIPALVQKRIRALSAKDTNGERYAFRVWHDPCTE